MYYFNTDYFQSTLWLWDSSMLWMTFRSHCLNSIVNIPQFIYLFYGRWALQQYWYEHSNTCLSVNVHMRFCWLYIKEWTCQVIGYVHNLSLIETAKRLSKVLYQLTFPPAMYERSNSSTYVFGIVHLFLFNGVGRFNAAPRSIWFTYFWSLRFWASLNIFIDHLDILLCEVSVQVFYPF